MSVRVGDKEAAVIADLQNTVAVSSAVIADLNQSVTVSPPDLQGLYTRSKATYRDGWYKFMITGFVLSSATNGVLTIPFFANKGVTGKWSGYVHIGGEGRNVRHAFKDVTVSSFSLALTASDISGTVNIEGEFF